MSNNNSKHMDLITLISFPDLISIQSRWWASAQ